MPGFERHLRPRLLSGRRATFDAIFEAIRQARDHVHLEYYIFEPDRIGTALRDLLIERAGRRAVRLLLDALGSKRIGRLSWRRCGTRGFHRAVSRRTIGRRLRPVTNYRTHRKIVVCDGRVGFTGGVNITDEEDARTRADAYHDVHLRIEGQRGAMAADDLSRRLDLRGRRGPPRDRPGRLPPAAASLAHDGAGEIPVQIVTSGPDTRWRRFIAFTAAIQSSVQRAWLTTPISSPANPP